MKVTRFTVNPFSENTYILWDSDSKEAAIIDPGMCNIEENNAIDNFIANNKLHLKYLLLTHLHLDHSFGCEYIKAKYGMPISGATSENVLGINLPMQAKMYGLPFDIKPIQIEIPLTEDDTLSLGNENIILFSIPGHSPGSIVYYAPESNFIIAGDVLFQQSIGRTDLLGGDYDTLISGIKSKLLTLPLDTVVYPGHGDTTTIGDEKMYNQYLR